MSIKEQLAGVECIRAGALSPCLVARNTVRYHREDGTELIRLHQTDIIERRGGLLTLRNGGYYTMTTRQRLSQFSGFAIDGGTYAQRYGYCSREGGPWYIREASEPHWHGRPFADGMVIEDGLLPDEMPLRPRAVANGVNRLARWCDEMCNFRPPQADSDGLGPSPALLIHDELDSPELMEKTLVQGGRLWTRPQWRTAEVVHHYGTYSSQFYYSREMVASVIRGALAGPSADRYLAAIRLGSNHKPHRAKLRRLVAAYVKATYFPDLFQDQGSKQKLEIRQATPKCSSDPTNHANAGSK